MMGTFHTSCTPQHLVHRDRMVQVPKLLVDTGNEYTWVDGTLLSTLGVQREKKDVAFLMANGQQVTRSVGFGIVPIGEHFTVDEIVFGKEGDLQLLGARSLEGLNLTVDSRQKKLVAAGPLPAASNQSSR